MSSGNRNQSLFTKRVVGPSTSLRLSAFNGSTSSRSPHRKGEEGSTPSPVDIPFSSTPTTVPQPQVHTDTTAPLLSDIYLGGSSTEETPNSSFVKRVNTFSLESESPLSDTKRISLAMKALIGQGSFGKVYQAMDRDTNRIIAVKEIALTGVSGSLEDMETVRRELAVQKQLDHPNIVKYLGDEVHNSFLRIYMEYVPCGSISTLLKTFGPLQDQQASMYVKQILDGLVYLHQKRIVHRDLKGDNLLVNADGSLKLADFGTAKDLNNTATLNKVRGTANFMSPEAIEGKPVNEKADIWSLGCCVVEMLAGVPPLSTFPTQYAIMIKVAESEGEILHMYIPEENDFSAEALDFIKQCLRRNPEKRPSAAALRKHRWITSRSEMAYNTTLPYSEHNLVKSPDPVGAVVPVKKEKKDKKGRKSSKGRSGSQNRKSSGGSQEGEETKKLGKKSSRKKKSTEKHDDFSYSRNGLDLICLSSLPDSPSSNKKGEGKDGETLPQTPFLPSISGSVTSPSNHAISKHLY